MNLNRLHEYVSKARGTMLNKKEREERRLLEVVGVVIEGLWDE